MSVELPEGLQSYVESKVKGNGSGGRPHFLAEKAREKDPALVILDIAELAWLKQRSVASIGRKMGTGYHTIYRLLDDLAPYKDELVNLIETTPRRKTFWHRELMTSDYETVQRYIDRAEQDELKGHKAILTYAEKVWRAMGYKDPANWTRKDVVAYIKTLSDGTQINYVNGVRQVAPQFRDQQSPDYLSVSLYREKIKKRKKPLFAKEVMQVHEAIEAHLTPYHRLVFDLHVTVGAREGARNPQSGMSGLSWERFKRNFSKVDDWESKVRSRGIWWRNCPVNLFFKDLPKRLRALWTERGKPNTGKVIKRGYKELLQIYKDIRKACQQYWQGKLEPSLLNEMTSLSPHDADKIHCNLCWEAKIPLEVVAGQHLGKDEGIGLVGRGWLNVDTIKKYYLSLSQRSDAYKDMMAKVTAYASQFNGAD